MKNNQKPIPIFFSCDDNYLPYLAVSIRSLIENASTEYSYRLHILNNGLDRARLSLILEMQTERVEIVPVDVSNAIAPIAEKLDLRDYYTVSIYFRLFIASMFPQYQKAIYLDADIAVCGDISALYGISLGDRIVGAVSDDIIASHPDFQLYASEGVGVPWRRYFNSGVLLMNLDRFREEEIERKFVHLLRTYHFRTVCPDQDYLNVLCRGKVLYLDKSWNKMSIDADFSGIPNIVHYNMFYKPWQYKHIPYADQFWYYAAMTPFYAELCRTRAEFGLRQKWGHVKANRALHKNARRIAALPDNFYRVLGKKADVIASEPHFEVIYEA